MGQSCCKNQSRYVRQHDESSVNGNGHGNSIADIQQSTNLRNLRNEPFPRTVSQIRPSEDSTKGSETELDGGYYGDAYLSYQPAEEPKKASKISRLSTRLGRLRRRRSHGLDDNFSNNFPRSSNRVSHQRNSASVQWTMSPEAVYTGGHQEFKEGQYVEREMKKEINNKTSSANSNDKYQGNEKPCKESTNASSCTKPCEQLYRVQYTPITEGLPAPPSRAASPRGGLKSQQVDPVGSNGDELQKPPRYFRFPFSRHRGQAQLNGKRSNDRHHPNQIETQRESEFGRDPPRPLVMGKPEQTNGVAIPDETPSELDIIKSVERKPPLPLPFEDNDDISVHSAGPSYSNNNIVSSVPDQFQSSVSTQALSDSGSTTTSLQESPSTLSTIEEVQQQSNSVRGPGTQSCRSILWSKFGLISGKTVDGSKMANGPLDLPLSEPVSSLKLSSCGNGSSVAGHNSETKTVTSTENDRDGVGRSYGRFSTCEESSPLVSSRHEFERYVPPGTSINEKSIQLYLEDTFNVTSRNPITLDMVQVRLRLMEELAVQEDVIFEKEREYNEAFAANHLGGLLRGWVEDAEAAKQKEHAFSFTSVSSKAYTLQPELAQQLQQRVVAGHPSGLPSPSISHSQCQSIVGQTTTSTSLTSPVSGTKGVASVSSPSGSVSSRRRHSTTFFLASPTLKDEKQKRKHETTFTSPTGSPLFSLDTKRGLVATEASLKRHGGKSEQNDVPSLDPSMVQSNRDHHLSEELTVTSPTEVHESTSLVAMHSTDSASAQIDYTSLEPPPFYKRKSLLSPKQEPITNSSPNSQNASADASAIKSRRRGPLTAAKTKTVPTTPLSTRRSATTTTLAPSTSSLPVSAAEISPVSSVPTAAAKSGCARRRRTTESTTLDDSTCRLSRDSPTSIAATRRKLATANSSSNTVDHQCTAIRPDAGVPDSNASRLRRGSQPYPTVAPATTGRKGQKKPKQQKATGIN